MNSKTPTPSEDHECLALVAYLRQRGFKFTHIANESGLPPRVAMIAAIRKKKLGTAKGFPDYCVIIPNKPLVFIEMKRAGATASHVKPEQWEWIEALNAAGCHAFAAAGAAEAIREIEVLQG